MSSPLPQLQCLVAFNNGPLDDPALITTVASPPGTLGAANVWTDITSSPTGAAGVTSLTIRRGRQHELDQFEAGECQLELSNYDGRFYPWNTSGPFFGLLLPRKLLQIRATWGGTTYTLFTGHVDSWPVVWSDPLSGLAECHATDAFRLFQRGDITSSAYAAQVLADGATAYFRLNDPVGSTSLADASGHSQVLQYTEGLVLPPLSPANQLGQPGLLPSAPGNSFQVQGIASGNYTLANPLIAGTAPSFVPGNPTAATMECWVNAPTSFVDFELWWKSGTNQWGFTVVCGSAGCSVVDSNNTTLATSGGPTPVTGAPAHFVMTVDTAAPKIVVYLNGVAIITYTGAVTAYGGGVGPAAAYACQVINNIGASTNIEAQELAFYPSALSAAQVQNHYQLGAFPQEGTGSRIGRVLNTLNWPSGPRSIDTGNSQVQAMTSSLTQTSSLSHMQDVETTEAGALYMTVDGKVRFISRGTLWSDSRYQTVQATFGDNPGSSELVYLPNPTLGLDDLDIYNEATATRQNGQLQTVNNPTSVAAYGRTTWTPNGTLLGVSDVEVLGRLNLVLAEYEQPIVRLQSFTVDLIDLITPNQVGTLLALELLYRVTVNRHGPPGGGSAFTQTGLVEHIQHTITPDSWTVDFAFDVADTSQQFFVWGLGQWGTAVWGF